MELPNNQIGISDIKAWRDCPRRMSLSMRRWEGDGDAPEAESDATRYGTAMHKAFHLIATEGITDQEAIKRVADKLWPHEIKRLERNLETYHARDDVGVRMVGSELDIRVPLPLVHNGQQMYFRAQIDRLYERLDAPGHFIHRDYKSSTWSRSDSDVHSDLQLWAYNFAIHEYFPECDRLTQILDMAEFEEVVTYKTQEQREQMRDWLVWQVEAILNDNNYQDDGLLAPQWNEWCGTCSLKRDCPVIDKLTANAKLDVDVTMPEYEGIQLDGPTMEKVRDLTERYERAKDSRKVLESFEDDVKDLLKKLPPADLEELGYTKRSKAIERFEPMALKEIHEAFGDDFYRLISLTKSKISDVTDGTQEGWIKDLAVKAHSAPFIAKKGGSRKSKLPSNEAG